MTAEPDVTMADFFFRILGLIALAVIIVSLFTQLGCTYNRNAPLLESTINANGNTIPLTP